MTWRTSTDPPNSKTGQSIASSVASWSEVASMTRLPVTRSFDSAYGPSVTVRFLPRIVLPVSSSGCPPEWRPAFASSPAHAYHLRRCASISVGERLGISGAPPRKMSMYLGIVSTSRSLVSTRASRTKDAARTGHTPLRLQMRIRATPPRDHSDTSATRRASPTGRDETARAGRHGSGLLYWSADSGITSAWRRRRAAQARGVPSRDRSSAWGARYVFVWRHETVE